MNATLKWALPLIAALAALVVFFLRSRQRLTGELQARQRDLERLLDTNRALEKDSQQWQARALVAELDNTNLSRFRAITDTETEIQRMQEAAQMQLTDTRDQAFKVLRDASDEAVRIRTLAREGAVAEQEQARQSSQRAEHDAREIRARAQAELDTARARAATIKSEAQVQAERTAGDALKALQNVDELRREAKAIENLIKGYGNDYIVPTHSFLDDLAEGFGFTEAGAQLKKSREQTRRMIKNESAAACDYAEANRRDTAVAFVIDAFNGKVDSILSRIKADNAGTLQQEIRDAFTLVNMNGSAFRNARITAAYLDARLEELRWAVATQELRDREREEQRRIKERIREEEKARRDYEKAMRDAEKEEEAIRKTMEKVQAEVSKASAAQRMQYEQQLAELAQKLQAAEDKNKRALSMAQQTKTGHVYVISNIGSFGEDVFKIGLTRRLEPIDRIRELGDASVPFEFDVHALIRSEDAPALESALHRHFLAAQVNKVNPRKEFFRASLKLIREEIEKLGIQAMWTMSAAATEYRESLAIDRAIKANPAKLQAWRDRQLVLEQEVHLEDADQPGAS